VVSVGCQVNKFVRFAFAVTWIVWLPPLMVVAFYVFVMGRIFSLLTPDSEKVQNASPQDSNATVAPEGEPPPEVRQQGSTKA
jgi:hypothetical protein